MAEFAVIQNVIYSGCVKTSAGGREELPHRDYPRLGLTEEEKCDIFTLFGTRLFVLCPAGACSTAAWREPESNMLV